MSPYLFVLCMEKLACLIATKVQDKSWKPIHVSKGGPRISHLFFADDILLFVKEKNSHVRLMQSVLDVFCKASRLRMNYDKSRIICSKRVSRRKKDKIAQISSIRVANDLGRYLGFRLIKG